MPKYRLQALVPGSVYASAQNDLREPSTNPVLPNRAAELRLHPQETPMPATDVSISTTV